MNAAIENPQPETQTGYFYPPGLEHNLLWYAFRKFKPADPLRKEFLQDYGKEVARLRTALELPAIGCAKSLLVGRCSGLPEPRGSSAPLVDRGEIVGAAVRTRTGVRPVYVSVGHRVTLAGACALVLATSRFRIPEPLRAADAAVRRLARRL